MVYANTGGRMLPPAVHILRHGQGSLPPGSCVIWRLTKELLFSQDSGHQRQAVSGEIALWPSPTLRWSNCSTLLGEGFCTKHAAGMWLKKGGGVWRREREKQAHLLGSMGKSSACHLTDILMWICMCVWFRFCPSFSPPLSGFPFLFLFLSPRPTKLTEHHWRTTQKPHHQQCHGHYLLRGNTQPWIKHMPHYTFQLKVNLSYWHAASNSIKAKWNTGSI